MNLPEGDRVPLVLTEPHAYRVRADGKGRAKKQLNTLEDMP